jgi:two-component system response regulator AtoC
MSAYGNNDLALEAMKAGAYDYVSKPFKPDEIVLALRKAEERETLRRENRALKEQIREGEPVRVDPRQEPADGRDLPHHHQDRRLQDDGAHLGRERRRQGARRARDPRALDRARTRRSSPSTAAPSPRTSSRASSSATRRGVHRRHERPRGLFEEANGGTLFLDEIGELPLNLQVKLLRVLQEETIRRVGDSKDMKVDVRIVAATHRDLAAEAKAGRFREDLFYRINVLAIASRRSAAPRGHRLLIDHFLARNNARMGTRIRGLSNEARKLLLEYAGRATFASWRTRSSARWSSPRDVLEIGDLPERIREALDPVQMQLASGELSIKKTTAAIEEILIRRALTKTKGNRTRAAEILEISHRALLYKIKDYKIASCSVATGTSSR